MEITDIDIWAPHIGTFILRFGTIELFTKNILKELLPPNEFEEIKNKTLKEKIKHLNTALDKCDEDLDLHHELFKAYQCINKLANYRNIIAHSTINIVFTTDNQNNDSAYIEALYSEKKEEIITLDTVKDYNMKLSELINTLYSIKAKKITRRLNNENGDILKTSLLSQ
ncbi:Uncharacterised protein [Edwardsiella tarda]|uniref:Uncharacterized protein n=1 Tax=Edwardsiella tarda ATCC 15947 = NBRC 105688 TaxID=667121 RepID=A0AC61TM56_EDWTA|nr:hypothetical protein [Edwardsiella tarda]UAL55299.1 hypothetical protein K8O98_10625 [Edwardsiella tarda]UCQ01660.1 hypothetical protein DCL27_07885 [Edwardsiella tarda ATCC 15947 = NBRC 105688]STD29369.1 Uncharacterised protein [Edwardsiella tarda]